MEYAIEAINNAGTCVGVLAKDGIVMAAERKVISKLLAPSKTSEKTYRRVPPPCVHVQLKTFYRPINRFRKFLHFCEPCAPGFLWWLVTRVEDANARVCFPSIVWTFVIMGIVRVPYLEYLLLEETGTPIIFHRLD